VAKKVRVRTLSNGLRVIFYNYNIDWVQGILLNRAGPRVEQPEELGLTHIFEHLCARNAKAHFEMENLGEGLENAYTGGEDVSYWFSFLKRNALAGIESFFRLWTAPVTVEDFEREREVLQIEYAERNSVANPGAVLYDLLMRTGWQGHPLRFDDTLLWHRNLSRLTYEQFHKFRPRINCGNNTVLVLIGHIPIRKLMEVLERTFGMLPVGHRPTIKSRPLKKISRFTVVKKSGELDLAYCLLAFPFPKLKSRSRRALELISGHLGDSEHFSSALFQKVREDRSLVYSIFTDTFRFSDSGAFYVFWVCPPKNVQPVLDIIRREMRGWVNGKISAVEFERARHVLALKWESSQHYSDYIVGELAEELTFGGKVSNPRLWAKTARSMRRSDAIEVARRYLKPNQALLTMYGKVGNLRPRF